MDKVFLDGDVLLDHLMDRKPYSKAIAVILSLGDLKQIKLYSSVLVFANCYYILRKFSTHQKVIENLKSLAVFIDFAVTGKKEILDALQSSFKDFEDALQNAAATSSGIPILITRNTKDYRTSGLSVMTPDEYLASLT
jgi:predicted nucleic acid-binding protein